MKCLCGLLLLLFGVMSVAGQSDVDRQLIKQGESKQLVPQLLHSTEKKDQAWGAYLIGKHQLTEFVPTLQEKLKLNISNASWNDLLVYRVILDTLILLDARIPAEELLPLYKKLPNETLILLANAPEQNQKELLLLLAQTETCSQWLPVGTLLTKMKPPELALALLQQLRIEVNIFVTNNKKEEGGLGYGPNQAGAIIGFPKDFPPIAFYDFTFVAEQDSAVFATGRHPIYYKRHVYEPEKGRSVSENILCQDFAINSYRLEFLAELLNINSKELGLRATQVETVVWKGEMQCQREFEQIKLKLEDCIDSLFVDLSTRIF